MDLIFVLLIAAGALVLGGVGGYLLFRFVLKGKYNEMVDAAEKQAEVVKEKKLLEVKEKFLNKKSELEKEVQQRNQHIQQNENRLKQREISLNQRQEELGRRKNELDGMQTRIDNEKKLLAVKAEELEKMQLKEREMLEEVSGLSAEDAKARLVESMKDEAKTAAASYINEIMDEAKLNANAQAKKIVIQTIQRVALSVVKVVTSVPSRQQQALRLWLMTPLRPSLSLVSILSVVRFAVWLFISSSAMVVSILPVLKRW